ncbi:MAG: radical SAM protein [bacterium]
MKILLVQPPVRDFYHTGHRMYPLGLLYLAASLKRAGFACQVLDAFGPEQKTVLPIPPAMNYLREYYPDEDKSPFRLFGRFHHFGLSDEKIREKLRDADLVGISSLFTPYEEEALGVARIAKGMGKLTVLGGNHATVAALHLMEDPALDYVICGEGETRLVALAEAICGRRAIESIDGLALRRHGLIRLSPPKGLLPALDDLPVPDRSLLDPDRYRFQGSRYTMMLSSRGCPFQCRFCAGHAVMGNSVRHRSIESILAEMRLCYDQYQIRIFDFEDEHFTWQKERTLRLLDAIESEFGQDETFRLLFENGLFPHCLDREILDRLNRLGCRHLNLPLVTSSKRILKKLNRPGSPASFSRTVSEAGMDEAAASEEAANEAADADAAGIRDAGIHEAGCKRGEGKRGESGFFITGYLILGLPGSDLEEMVESIRFLAGQRVLIAPSIFYATPGMDMYCECRENGWLPADGGFSILRSSAFPIETDCFSRLDLVTLFRLIRVLNFIKSLIDEEGGKKEKEKGREVGKPGVMERTKGEMKLSEFLQALIAQIPPPAAVSGMPGVDFPLLPGESIIASSRPLSPRELGLCLLSGWSASDTPPAFYRIQRVKQRQKRPEDLGQRQGPPEQGGPEQGGWIYRMLRQRDSERVWELFLDRMNYSPIRGIRHASPSLVWDITRAGETAR